MAKRARPLLPGEQISPYKRASRHLERSHITLRPLVTIAVECRYNPAGHSQIAPPPRAEKIAQDRASFAVGYSVQNWHLVGDLFTPPEL